MSPAIARLNAAQADEAAIIIAPLVEQADWVCEAAVACRPFSSDEDLAWALVEIILAATPPERLALIRGHPELAGEDAVAGRMNEESSSEQARLGLTQLPEAAAERLRALNARYRDRFGHPFILALHRMADLDELFSVFERRLASTPLEEHTTTIAEIASVIRARCRARFGVASPAL